MTVGLASLRRARKSPCARWIFWRIENGKIRENWVMVDILDAFRAAWRRRARQASGVQQGTQSWPNQSKRRASIGQSATQRSESKCRRKTTELPPFGKAPLQFEAPVDGPRSPASCMTFRDISGRGGARHSGDAISSDSVISWPRHRQAVVGRSAGKPVMQL